jgi:signal transduction histidine kinase
MIDAASKPATLKLDEIKVNSKPPLLKVLMVEDNSADCELVLRELRRAQLEVSARSVQTQEEFKQQIATNPPDVVLADYNLGSWRGMDTLEIMQSVGLDIPLILVSGALGDLSAVDCIKQGATDYVLKDALARLPVSIKRALKEKQLRAERKRAVDDLAERARELTRSNQELEQFAYVASHDLQEPLRMVASYTQLLGERYRGKLDENADKYIGYAVEGAIRMQTLIQDMLAFSRAGRRGTELEATDCNQVLERALLSLQGSMTESGAVVLHDSLPAVMANSVHLQQVFQNLMGNAIKFRGADPPVIQIEAQSQGSDWLFSVRDNGIGISSQYAEDIFIIFKRLHTRTEYSGNGIGLAICKRIIEQCGGKIWVESHEGPGTTFKFTLRAAAPQPVPQRTEQPMNMKPDALHQESLHSHENHAPSLIS